MVRAFFTMVALLVVVTPTTRGMSTMTATSTTTSTTPTTVCAPDFLKKNLRKCSGQMLVNQVVHQ